MIDDIKKDAAARMTKSVESLGENLAKVRTGRAHPMQGIRHRRFRSG